MSASLRPLMALCFCCSALTASAQYTIKRLVFDGKTPYTQAQLERASGLKSGDPIGAKQLGDAAQRLMNTGAFDDIQPKLDGPVKEINVVFKVKPTDDDKLLPVVLENFAWFTSSELDAELHMRVPLYRDRLPEAGDLRETVVAALKQMLAEKHVDAVVEGTVLHGSASTPNPVIDFRVTSPEVVLESVSISGVSKAMAPYVNKTVRSAVGRSYRDGLEAQILNDYLDAGFRDAKLMDLKHLPIMTAGAAHVALTGAVEPGELYVTKSVTWEGSPVLSTNDFATVNKLRPGETYSQASFAAAQQILVSAYQNAGYMDVKIDPGAEVDRAAHTVSFTFHATPGEVYRVQTVKTVGLSPKQQREFDSAWLLQPGKPYNPGYVSGFLKNNTALRSLDNFAASFKSTADPQTHLVDVVMTFQAMAQKQ